MSKQSDAKEAQGYNPKPVPRTCQNCDNFRFETVFSHEYLDKKYFVDKKLRCAIGGFAVKKAATCNEFKYRIE